MAGAPRTTSLLQYDVIANPSPLRAGQKCALDIIVTNALDKVVHCKQISVVFPVGPNAQDLAANAEHITGLDVQPVPPPGVEESMDPYDWTAVHVQDGVVTLVPHQEWHQFRAVAGTDGHTHAILVRIAGIQVNAQPGTSSIELLETATDDLDDWPDSPTTTRLAVPRYRIPGTANSVALWTLDSRGRTATRMAAGRVVLRWNGAADVSYRIQKNDETPVPVPPGKTEKEFTDIVRDTTFTLINDHTKTVLATTTVMITSPSYHDLGMDRLHGAGAGATITGTLDLATLDVAKKLSVAGDWQVAGKVAVAKHGRIGH